jgi:hypothetical protein
MLHFESLDELKTTIPQSSGPFCCFVDGFGEIQVNSHEDIFAIAGKIAMRYSYFWEYTNA